MDDDVRATQPARTARDVKIGSVRFVSVMNVDGFLPKRAPFFDIKKPIGIGGVALSRILPAQARGFAIDHIWSPVDGHTCRIRKNNFAI